MTNVTDPIGDLLTRMRNAQHVRHDSCRAPYSAFKHQLLDLLKSEGWIADVQVEGEVPKKELIVEFAPDKPKLTLERISKPGRRVYTGSKELKPVLRGFGCAVVTTSEGLMTDSQAREKNIGGEILCTIS